METPVFQTSCKCRKLSGTVESCTIGAFEVDSGRQCSQIHEPTISITHRYITERHISISQLNTLSPPREVTGSIYNEIAQQFSMPYQFQEDGGSTCIHLELVLYFAGIRNVGRDEVHVVHDAAKVIFGSGTHISADTKGEFPFFIHQQEAWALGSWMYLNCDSFMIRTISSPALSMVTMTMPLGASSSIITFFLCFGYGRNGTDAAQ